MSMESATLEQTPLLDLGGKELNSMWVDETQALFIPNNPLHWKAHKLQVLLNRLDLQASKNPAQFNSANYVKILDEYTNLMEQIKRGEVLDEGGVAKVGGQGTTATDSEIKPISLDS